MIINVKAGCVDGCVTGTTIVVSNKFYQELPYDLQKVLGEEKDSVFHNGR